MLLYPLHNTWLPSHVCWTTLIPIHQRSWTAKNHKRNNDRNLEVQWICTAILSLCSRYPPIFAIHVGTTNHSSTSAAYSESIIYLCTIVVLNFHCGKGCIGHNLWSRRSGSENLKTKLMGPFQIGVIDNCDKVTTCCITGHRSNRNSCLKSVR